MHAMNSAPRRASTLVGRLDELVQASPDRLLFTYRPDRSPFTVSLTAGELHTRASRLARYLRSFASEGDRVLLVAPFGLEFHIAFLACLYARLVAVPAHPPSAREKKGDKNVARITSIIRDCQPRVVLSTFKGREALASREGESVFGDLVVLASDDSEVDAAQPYCSSSIRGQDVAFLQYTSGSTADPKGVMLTQENIVANQALISRKFGIDSGSTIVSWLPVYHDMGLCSGLFQGLYTGAHSILLSPLTFLMHPGRWLETISQYQANISGAPNFAYDLCLARLQESDVEHLDLRSWRVAFSGSETVRAGTLHRFAKRFEKAGFRAQSFYPCYGLAEATLFVSGGTHGAGAKILTVDRTLLGRGQVAPTSDDATAQRLVGCGNSFGECDVQIVDPKSCGPCPERTIGEIWVRSPSVGQGYWGRPELSESTFQATIAGASSVGYLRTGDLGFVDQGELYIAGRMKEMLIFHGANLYPQDIEAVVEQAHPDVGANASAAFTVDCDDERERLVVLTEVARGARTSSVAEIQDCVRRMLAKRLELQVHDVVLLRPGTIPRTSSGKIQRVLCRQHYQVGGFREEQYIA